MLIKGSGDVGQIEEGGEGERECFWPAMEAGIIEAEEEGGWVGGPTWAQTMLSVVQHSPWCQPNEPI